MLVNLDPPADDADDGDFEWVNEWAATAQPSRPDARVPTVGAGRSDARAVQPPPDALAEEAVLPARKDEAPAPNAPAAEDPVPLHAEDMPPAGGITAAAAIGGEMEAAAAPSLAPDQLERDVFEIAQARDALDDEPAPPMARPGLHPWRRMLRARGRSIAGMIVFALLAAGVAAATLALST